jgi:TolB protein
MFLPSDTAHRITCNRSFIFLSFPLFPVFLFTLLLFTLLLFTQCRHAKKTYDYCYSSGTTLILFSIKDNRATRIKLQGSGPSLSPDGTMLAYTNDADSHRRIALLDLDNDKTSILDSACTNCWGPVWSPDGRYIAYDVYTHVGGMFNDNAIGSWGIAVIGLEDRDTVIVSKNTSARFGSNSPAWSADSKKLIFQDLEFVHIVDLKGNPLKDIPDSVFPPNSGISFDSKFLLTADGKKIVFNVERGDSLGIHPPGAIFVFDTLTQKTIRISPKGYDCSQPFLKDGRVFFDAIKKASEKKYNIYSVDLNGKDLKLEFRNRQDFTYKRDN